jgi:glutathione-regulated potassium-efflux system ancillary protein KefC
MGLFFVAVGMSIDFALLASQTALVVALVLGFTGLKSAALFLLSWPVGVPPGRRPAFAALLAQGSEFAFVVFGVAGAADVLPGEWNKLLTLMVALSLVLTPLLAAAAEWLQTRLSATTREADRVEAEEGAVLIVGFGRFGQIVGRLLFASGIRATVLDHDPDNIEVLRRLGFRVFYGDGTRLDLLTSAGAERASVIIDAIDDMDANLKLVDVARQYFPGVHVVARARDVTHWRELRERGVRTIERETFESALRVGRRALEALGIRSHEARERADRFRRHNLLTLESVVEGWDDEDQRFSQARTARIEFERQFQKDQEELEAQIGHSWRREDAEG